MKKIIEKIQNICKENKKVAMFIDMDGTITVYEVYPEGNVKEKMEDTKHRLIYINTSKKLKNIKGKARMVKKICIIYKRRKLDYNK